MPGGHAFRPDMFRLDLDGIIARLRSASSGAAADLPGRRHQSALAQLVRQRERHWATGFLQRPSSYFAMCSGRSFILMGGTGGRRIDRHLAPIRVNLVAAGFVDTPPSASLLGDQLEDPRTELRATLPIGRVVGPDAVAVLAVHLMVNTAPTCACATSDIDGGQQFV